MISHSDICIVGNGAVGKAAALGFAQAGLNVQLLVSASGSLAKTLPSGAWDARVYALNPAARSLLSSLRVWDAIDGSRIAPIESMVVHGDGERQAGCLNFDAYGARVGALAWIVEDGNLSQALDSALKFAPNVRIVAGKAAELRVDGECATIRLDNGDTLISSLLIGADGAQSWVRNQCDIGIDYRSYGQRAIVANFACEKPHQGAAFQWFAGSEGIIALLPLPGQRVSLVWSAPDALAAALLDEPLMQLAQRLTALPAQPLGCLTPMQPENVHAFPLAMIRPHAITAPRVALIGDAAHVVHPLAGHGMNLGFADVNALLNIVSLREPSRSCGDARLLGQYARARKEDILLMQLTTDTLQRLFATDIAPFRVARNIGLNMINRLPGLKRRLISHAMGRSALPW